MTSFAREVLLDRWSVPVLRRVWRHGPLWRAPYMQETLEARERVIAMKEGVSFPHWRSAVPSEYWVAENYWAVEVIDWAGIVTDRIGDADLWRTFLLEGRGHGIRSLLADAIWRIHAPYEPSGPPRGLRPFGVCFYPAIALLRLYQEGELHGSKYHRRVESAR